MDPGLIASITFVGFLVVVLIVVMIQMHFEGKKYKIQELEYKRNFLSKKEVYEKHKSKLCGFLSTKKVEVDNKKYEVIPVKHSGGVIEYRDYYPNDPSYDHSLKLTLLINGEMVFVNKPGFFSKDDGHYGNEYLLQKINENYSDVGLLEDIVAEYFLFRKDYNNVERYGFADLNEELGKHLDRHVIDADEIEKFESLEQLRVANEMTS